MSRTIRRFTSFIITAAIGLAVPASAQADVLANWGSDAVVSPFVSGIAVGAGGDVYVADAARSRISVFTRSGDKLRDWGSYGSGPGAFVGLSSVAVGPDGSVYAADATSVQKFTPDGGFVTRWGGWGSAPGAFEGTSGIAVGADGTVYVTDRGNRRVQAFDATGAFLRIVVKHDKQIDLDDPRGIAVAADGTLVVAESNHDRLFVLSPTGALIDSWGSPGVIDVAIDPTDGTVLATDKQGHVVRRYQPDGAPAGTLGAGNAPASAPGERLNSPAAVATDCRGAAYVADRSDLRLHVFGPAGLPAPPCIAAPAPPAPPPGPQREQEPDPQIQVAPAVAQSPTPTLGKSGVGEVVDGTVLVRKPGETKFERLVKASNLPVGTTVDVSNGRIRVTFQTAPEDLGTYGPTQSAEFWGGEFRFFQASSGSLVDVILTGQQPSCDDPALRLKPNKARTSQSKRGKKTGRFVWGRGKGKFRTTGNNGAATVRGTYWYTEDRCDGTFFRTREGIVDVSDFGAKKKVPVKAGERYLARAPCTSRRAFPIRLLVPAGTPVADAQVIVNGKRVRVTSEGARPTARINLRGRPKQKVRVRITLRLANGQVLSGVREYQTCTPRRTSSGPPSL
jgi:DNA-binding beta-propeller fold protein YncE